MISNFYNGMKINVNDTLMSETVEDWSGVRSLSRAKRRIKRGFKQNVTFKIVPKDDILVLKEQNLMIMHSQTLKKFQKEMAKREEFHEQRKYF